jgi:hypothetical protein
MKWLIRSLWLAAWGVWLWLGVGLHRELPRKFGPRIANLNLQPGFDQAVGFIGETNRIVVTRSPPADGPLGLVQARRSAKSVEVLDVATSIREGGTSPPREFDASDFATLRFAPRYGFLFLVHHDHGIGGSGNVRYRGLNVLDPLSGGWRNLAPGVIDPPIIHKEQPWIAFVQRAGWGQPPRLVVVDFITNKRLLDRAEGRNWKFADRPYFVPKGSTLVVPVRSPGKHATLDDLDFELWDLEGEPRLARTVSGWRIGDRASVSSTGRIAFGAHDPDSIHVFDVKQARLVFSDLPRSERPIGQSGPIHQPIGVEIAQDGRRVVGASGLWDVDGGRHLWRPNSNERLHGAGDGAHFVVDEHWGDFWKRWFPTFSYNTRALRRLDTGEFVYRVSHRQSLFGLEATRVVAFDGSIYLMPHVVDWLLLAICQTILATPLILTWTILRWRQRRRAARRRPAETTS